MRVKTLEDVERASKKTGLSAMDIANAFDIELSNPRLPNFGSGRQEDMWEVLRRTPPNDERSKDVRIEILRAIAQNAHSEEDMWKVFCAAPPGSDVRAEILRKIVNRIPE